MLSASRLRLDLTRFNEVEIEAAADSGMLLEHK